MAELEDPKKRKRSDDRLKELIDHNAKLNSYLYKLEFMLLETCKKHDRAKKGFKDNIVYLAEALDRAGYTVPPLPHKHLASTDHSEIYSLINEFKDTKKLDDEQKKVKKTGRPKKEAKIEISQI